MTHSGKFGPIVCLTLGIGLLPCGVKADPADFGGSVWTYCEQDLPGFKDLSGATVTFLELNMSCRTDQRGRFHFSHVPPGNYTIRATLKGYLPEEMTESFREDEICGNNFFLEEAPHFQQAELAADTPRSDAISEITLRRFGLSSREVNFLQRYDTSTNPGRYQVTLSRNGMATFHGEANVAMLGTYTGHVGREDFSRLASLLVAMNYFAIQRGKAAMSYFPAVLL